MTLEEEVRDDFEKAGGSIGRLFDVYVKEINIYLDAYKIPRNIPEHKQADYKKLQDKLQLAKKLVFKDPELTPQAVITRTAGSTFNQIQARRMRHGITRGA